MPAEAGDEPSADIDAPTAAGAVVVHIGCYDRYTDVDGGDGRGGSCVAADIAVYSSRFKVRYVNC